MQIKGKVFYKKPNHYFYRFLLLFTILINIFLYFQFSESNANTINKNTIPPTIELQNGDVVLRNGKGLISTAFRSSSVQHKQYTHAGFVQRINNRMFVYHFIDDKENSGLHIEKLDEFINADKCDGFAAYRYHLNEIEYRRLNSFITDTTNKLIHFDPHFDLLTDTLMYCTEWIAKTLNKATGKKDFIPNSISGSFTYVAPDNLYFNTPCELIYKYKY